MCIYIYIFLFLAKDIQYMARQKDKHPLKFLIYLKIFPVPVGIYVCAHVYGCLWRPGEVPDGLEL